VAPGTPAAEPDAGFAEWDEAAHPRDESGKFAAAGSSSSVDDPAANRPSRPDERHPEATPTALAWRDPPPKRGVKGGGMPPRPRGDDAQGEIGDRGEEMLQELGFRNILPEGQRSHRPGEVALLGSTIDVEYDHSGKAYEVKVCNDSATEYRLKAKAKEKDDKLRYAQLHDLTPYTLVGVREVGTGEIHFYAAREPGFTGAEVSAAKFDYVGSVRP
jgi:hypothetical protein